MHYYCWKCHKSIETTERKIPFRAVCEHCGWDLHVCKNCKFYLPGKPNDCNIPNTDIVRDREAFNFCEEFIPLSEKPSLKKSKEDVEQSLFQNKTEKPKPFKDLFKDD
jgi:hypothetical protein